MQNRDSFSFVPYGSFVFSDSSVLRALGHFFCIYMMKISL